MMQALRKVAGANADLALIALVVGILAILFVPIPTQLLDLLLISNLSFALLVLLITFYTLKPVEFSTFPSLLLIATLFRLSMNIAATRLILSQADAGRVIEKRPFESAQRAETGFTTLFATATPTAGPS